MNGLELLALIAAGLAPYTLWRLATTGGQPHNAIDLDGSRRRWAHRYDEQDRAA